MTELDILLSTYGARLYARRVMAKAAILEERAERERQEKAEEFWSAVKRNRAEEGILPWKARQKSS